MTKITVMPVAIVGLVLTAIIGIGVRTYVPSSAHAQTASISSTKQADADKETNDDTISPKPVQNQTVKQADDKNENDKANNSSIPEVEDGK